MKATLATTVAFCALATSSIAISGVPAIAAGPLAIVVDRADDSPGNCTTFVPELPTCTLRAAVALANTHPGSSIFLMPLRYTLSGAIQIRANGTTLIGAASPGAWAGDHTIDAAGGRGLEIDADDVTVRGITITGAAAPTGAGSAIQVERNADRFRLESSMILGNQGRDGAGLYVAVAASATVVGSTFADNVATRKGGGVRVDGTIEVINSTFTRNLAQSGGAISVAGAAGISYSTFVENTSNTQKGGGVDRNGGVLAVTGSILSRANQQSTDGSDCSGQPDLIGPNFVGNTQGCQTGPDVIVGGMVDIGELTDAGGPTLTMPLGDDSVAIDRSDPDRCRSIGLDGVLDTNDPSVATDQRGLPRPAGVSCDLGAYEVTALDLGLTLRASTDTPFVGARFLPSSAISQSVLETDDLFRGSLAASPLSAFPLEAAPLSAFPLSAFPLSAFPLSAFPLSAFFTAAAPLSAFPLSAFPLSAFPLSAFPLSELVITDGSWDDLLRGTDHEGVPLQALTLSDVSDVPAVAELSVGDVNLEATPLSAFPLSAFLLGSVPLSAFPLSAFPAAENWCDLVPDFCTAGSVEPNDPRFTLASLALAGVPLSAFPLSAFPLSAFPLSAFPLSAFPLSAFPLSAFGWQASPLSAFPLSAFPLSAFDLGTVINCGLLPGGTCEGATLGDAAAAGAFADGAKLGDLGSLFIAHADAYAALADYSLADVVAGLIPAESMPWEQLDLTVPGLQNAGDPAEWTFQYLADLATTAPAAVVDVELTLPPGFAYVPGGSALDGAPIVDPVLSCPGGSCVDQAGAPTPITLRFSLADVPAGVSTLSVDTRAGFELGEFTASAEAQARAITTSEPISSEPASTTVTVVAPDQAPDVPIFVETNNDCGPDGSGDVNLGWVASSTDDIDLYKFDISAAAALCGVRADIFLSNLPADFDVVLYGRKSVPLRGEPRESIAYLDDVTLDLNPFDDIVQADSVQDIPQTLAAAGVDASQYAVAAISSNRDRGNERIRTGTLRAGTYYIQVTGYNGAVANTPYALRLRTDATVSRGPCAALPYPGVDGVANIAPRTPPAVDTLPTNLNTLFITNSQLLEFTYGKTTADDILASAGAVAAAAGSGVVGAILPVDAIGAVQDAYKARAADPCNPDRSNDVVRAIGDVIDTYVAARPGIEYIVIIGDDRQVPMANIVDDANFANERTFSQDFAGDANNESNAALAAGRYRSDDPYGSDAGIRIRDHELFVPERAVGRLVETPDQIIDALDNFVTYGGQLDPDTATRTALQTGYEFLTDGAELNADNLTDAGYTVDETLISDDWTDDDLIGALSSTVEHIDVIGIHAHFDENNALPAFDNFNPQPTNDGLFDTTELPAAVDRSIVYSMGCHSGYSLSDVQVGVPVGETAPDWAQELADGRTNVFAGNTGYGYGDTDRIALTEMLTAIFADEVGKDGSIGQAWAAAKQRMLSELLVLDAYQEKSLQQFVLYGLPMFHVGTPPPNLGAPAPASNAQLIAAAATPQRDPLTGQPIAEIEFRRNLPMSAPGVPQFNLVETPDGDYYDVDGRTLAVNGRPIQPLYAADAPSYAGLRARDALITELTTVDAPGPFDPVFFWASPNFGGPRPEYLDGSFPAEMANVRGYKVRGEQREQVLVAAGQYRASDTEPDSGTQRLHTRVVTQVYYSDSDDFVAPAIRRSEGRFDDDAIQFDVEVDSSATRVYVLYRSSSQNVWSNVDLADVGEGSWRGVGPFAPDLDAQAEYIVQAVDEHGNVAISNAKSRYFLASTPGEVSDLALVATGDLQNGWYRGDVTVAAVGGGEFVEYRVDAGPFTDYDSAIVLSDTGTPGAFTVATGAHVVSAFDETGAFSALPLRIDSFGPTVSITRSPQAAWVGGPVTVTLTADDGLGSGPDAIEYALDGLTFVRYTGPFVVTAEGVSAVVARATDVAGNVGPVTSANVRVDTVAPTVTLSADPSVTWSNQPVTVTVDADDGAGSGIDSVEVSVAGAPFTLYSGPFEVAIEGIVIVTARATDLAGNIGVADGDDALVVRVDTSDPIVPTVQVADSVPLGQPIAADYSCDDDVSGVASCALEVAEPGGAMTLVDSDPSGGSGIELPSVTLGVHTVRVTAVDRAGNSTVREENYTVVDSDPPVASLTLTQEVVEMPATSEATFSCTDAESGIATCRLVVVGPGGAVLLTATGSGSGISLPVAALGTYEVTVTATDRGGNTATDSQSYVVVDTIMPTATVSVTSPTVSIGGTNAATFSCGDGGSGVASCTVTVTRPGGSVATVSTGSNSGTVPVPVVTAGAHVVTVTAVDVAGNSATSTASYDVRLCVIEMYDSSLSKQIGSNYTVRIQLCDANGKNISSQNIVLTAVSVTGSDGISFPPGPNDSGNANEGYAFRFSQKSYIYNLDTTGFPFVPPGSYTIDFTTAPVPDQSTPPPSLGSARFTLRM